MLSHQDSLVSDKAVKVLVPEILEQIDMNVLCTGYDVFDPELTRDELSIRGAIYEHALWALSNLAAH